MLGETLKLIETSRVRIAAFEACDWSGVTVELLFLVEIDSMLILVIETVCCVHTSHFIIPTIHPIDPPLQLSYNEFPTFFCESRNIWCRSHLNG